EELRGITQAVPQQAGRKASPIKAVLIIIAVVAIGFVALGSLLTLLGKRSAEDEAQEAKAARERHERIRANMLQDAKKNLAALDPTAPASEIARRCSQVVQLEPSVLT